MQNPKYPREKTDQFKVFVLPTNEFLCFLKHSQLNYTYFKRIRPGKVGFIVYSKESVKRHLITAKESADWLKNL